MPPGGGAGGIRLRLQVQGGQRLMGAMRRAAVVTSKVLRQALLKEGHELRKIIVSGLRAQAPGGDSIKPLKPITIALRGARGSGGMKSSKALIDSATMIRSVKVWELHGLSVFVGVHRSARSKDGKELANIAEIHEFGTKPFVIPVTDKMRRWWMAMVAAGVFNAPLSPTKTAIQHPGIPARPWLRPGYKLWTRTAKEDFKKNVLTGLAAHGVK